MFEPGGVVGIGNTGHAKQLGAGVSSVPPEQGVEIARRTSLICLTLSFCSFCPEPSPRAASARSASNSQQTCNCSYVAIVLTCLGLLEYKHPTTHRQCKPSETSLETYRSSIEFLMTRRLTKTSFSCPSRCTRSYACDSVA